MPKTSFCVLYFLCILSDRWTLPHIVSGFQSLLCWINLFLYLGGGGYKKQKQDVSVKLQQQSRVFLPVRRRPASMLRLLRVLIFVNLLYCTHLLVEVQLSDAQKWTKRRGQKRRLIWEDLIRGISSSPVWSLKDRRCSISVLASTKCLCTQKPVQLSLKSKTHFRKNTYF